MKQRIGRCTNFGNCPTADSKKKVPITGGDDTCPTCGSQLTEFYSAPRRLSKIGGIMVFLLLIGGSLVASWKLGWLKLPRSSSTPHTIPVSLELTGSKPQLVSESKCLLDSPPADNIVATSTKLSLADLQKMLPMTPVETLTKYPIPRDLIAWLKNVNQITESAFYIMRREVTVRDFKRYFAALFDSQRAQLGSDWQQDRNGAPLPDDYPIGSISWEAAKNYADWLATETGCALTLPTYAQWVAAVVQHAKPDQAITRQHQQSQYLRPTQRPPVPDEVMDLLGNLREWSLDQSIADQTCPNDGHYILGEDYKTWLQDIGGEPFCETMGLDTIGFRLVRLK